MKPLGQKPHKRNFPDVHPPKGYVNWWEKESCCDENKAAEKREAEREIERELGDENSSGCSSCYYCDYGKFPCNQW